MQRTASPKPNIILLFADDLGYGDLGCYGSPDVPTPHIDSIAAEGARFTDGYSSCAVCSPSRAALLTGRHQQRFGHEFNSGPPEREAEVNFGLPPSEKILPQYLKPAGYRSMVAGKWHLGIRKGYHPIERGFDEFFGFLVGGNSYITGGTPGARGVDANDSPGAATARGDKPLYRGYETVEEDRYLTDAFADEAVSFIKRNRANPFFLYLAFNAVHTPLHATDRYLRPFAHIQDPRHRMLAAMTVAMDTAVGRVLREVKRAGMDDNTLIVFLSDNGCPMITRAGSNGPLNGEKCTYYEGGIRVPFMMRWKGRIPAGVTYRHPVVSRDLTPTFLAAAGVPAPTGVTFDGVDLMPHLDGRNATAPHDALYWRAGKARATRIGKWKLVEFGEGYTKLYDLEADIGEKNDLAGKNPDVVRELRQSWQKWSREMIDPKWPARYRPLTVNGQELTWEL